MWKHFKWNIPRKKNNPGLTSGAGRFTMNLKDQEHWRNLTSDVTVNITARTVILLMDKEVVFGCWSMKNFMKWPLTCSVPGTDVICLTLLRPLSSAFLSTLSFTWSHSILLRGMGMVYTFPFLLGNHMAWGPGLNRYLLLPIPAPVCLQTLFFIVLVFLSRRFSTKSQWI